MRAFSRQDFQDFVRKNYASCRFNFLQVKADYIDDIFWTRGLDGAWMVLDEI